MWGPNEVMTAHADVRRFALLESLFELDREEYDGVALVSSRSRRRAARVAESICLFVCWCMVL